MTYNLMPEPSEMQGKVLSFFKKYCAEHGRSPSLMDVGSFLKRSTPTVISHITALVRKGFLAQGIPGAPRNLTLTEKGKSYERQET